jgi:hypothetical protein
MDDTEIERRIRQAGYNLQWESTPAGRSVFALRDGKRHTRGFETLLELGEYLGRVERPVRFVDDAEAVKAAMAKHVLVPQHFTVRVSACRVAVFNALRYVELVGTARDETAMYESGPDGLRKMSNGNLPPEIVAAFDRTPPARGPR